MSTNPAPSAASQFGLANAGVMQNQNMAATMAAGRPPVTYNFDPNQANTAAQALSRSQVLQNTGALADYSPQAAAGKTAAINTLTGGVPGDSAFLQNAALKSGLESAATSGVGRQGAAANLTPGGAGDAAAYKVFGSDLLNYRNTRAQQALGVAGAIQPDAALNPADAISLQTASGMQNVQNQNDWNAFLSQLNLGQVQGLQNQVQQSEGATQGAYNADTSASNANKGAAIAGGTALATAALGAMIL